MGPVDPHPSPAGLFFSLLAPDRAWLDRAIERIDAEFGKVILRGDVIDFSHSKYYAAEMGETLIRSWALTDKLIGQEEIVDIKKRSNEVESQIGERGGGNRTVNLDPGYVNLSKVVLGTTKDFAHRLYIGRGIYAEVTLTWRGKTKCFEPWPWTYPDHREPAAIDFFGRARQLYKQALREWEARDGS